MIDYLKKRLLLSHSRFICVVFMLMFFVAGYSQKKMGNKVFFSGQVLDKDNLEPISFAPVVFEKTSIGQFADAEGRFRFSISDSIETDTLKITYVGYEPFVLVYDKQKGSQIENLRILLEKAVIKHEVFLKSKYTKSYLLWRKVVRRKDKNNYNQFNRYGYKLDNRIEIDFNNINRQKLENNKLIKKFNFVLKNVDSSEFGKVVLPFFFTETISRLYYQKNPYKKRELIEGVFSSGIKNQSILELLGGSYQNFNFYDNQISLFNKELISPFATDGDLYYNFKILDTQYVNGQRLIHFLFVPKKYADNTFDGDCWIRDTLYAVQKINLRLSRDANINFVKRANFMEEFQLITDSLYFLKK